jgi:sodium transport system ATP-binding protein
MIRVEGLHKRFGAVTAVEEITFAAADGQVTGLLGPNGAGKTTTLRVLSTLVAPDRGRALVDGLDVQREPLAARARLGILPDARGLYPRLTPREHLRYFGELQGLHGAPLEAAIGGLLSRLELWPLADRRVEGFSNGERTKVALCRALVHGPQNVLLDEPTNGLDVLSTRAVRSLVRSLRAEGRCVLFSSHVMQEVAALCDRIVVVARGRVVAEGTADELLARTGQAGLEDAFLALVSEPEPQLGDRTAGLAAPAEARP